MDLGEIISIVERVGSLDPGLDRAGLCALAADVSRLERWVSSRRLVVTAALEQVSPFPAGDVAQAQRVTQSQADRAARQAVVVGELPGLGEAMADGLVSVEHVEVFRRAKQRLHRDLWPQFLARSASLVGLAAVATAQALDDAVSGEVLLLERRAAAEAGRDRFEEQRRATRVRTWTDRTTGMTRLTGAVDPLSGLRLTEALKSQVDAMFASGLPDTAPEDPFERQDHLRALALVELATGARAAGGSRDTVIAVVDGTKVDEDGNPDIQLPRGIELPDVILEQLLAAAKVHPVLVNRGCIVWAPGKLNLGRTTRIASRDQRRALRAVHRTCVIPGCDVAFDHCEIHHVWWYDHHGPTDLAVLAPVCVKHHHHIHDDGWDLAITADRRIVVVLPDGTVMRTGPPRQRAA